MVSVIEAVKEMISKESYAQQPVILSLELLDCKAGSIRFMDSKLSGILLLITLPSTILL
jgi:PBP1b-binding outer membrane lipoprotein LpoB